MKRTRHILLLTFTSGSFQISQHQTHYMMMIHIKHKPFLIFALVRHKQDHKLKNKKKHFYGKVTWSEPTACGRLLGGAGEILPLLLEREMLTKTWAASISIDIGDGNWLYTALRGGGGQICILKARSERRIHNKMNERKLFNVEREKWECLKETKWYDG